MLRRGAAALRRGAEASVVAGLWPRGSAGDGARRQDRARPRGRRARALGLPKRGALRTARTGSPKGGPDAKAAATPISDPRAELRRELLRGSVCKTFVYQFSVIAKPSAAAAENARAASLGRQRRRSAAVQASGRAKARAGAGRRQTRAAGGRARRAVRAVREGEQRAGVRAGGGARGMAGGDEARDASVPDDGAAAALVGEMGGAFGGARRVRGCAGATFGRRQRRGRRESAVVI